jgi:TolA-binding protein
VTTRTPALPKTQQSTPSSSTALASTASLSCPASAAPSTSTSTSAFARLCGRPSLAGGLAGVRAGIVAVGLAAGFAGADVRAQNLDKAIDSFKGGQYETAAAGFYSVLRLSEDQGEAVEAQYGLARSFEKLGLHLAALKYWSDIAEAGNQHPHFEKAIEGLINAGEALDDDLNMPKTLDKVYSGTNVDTIQKMNPEVLQRFYFHLGRFVYNRQNFKEARKMFKAVKEGNPAYPQAQYMLGLLRLGVGQADQPAPKYKEAIEHFTNARNAIPADATDPKLTEVRDLASLGLARLYYEQAYQLEDGDVKRAEGLRSSMLEFQRVPRFSEQWSEALFERAWAHTVNNEYGRALGALHSLSAPYFKDEFYPEAKILQAIIYYYNCQWDRVNSILDETRTSFEPMSARLAKIAEGNLDLDEWYPLLQKSMEQKDGTDDETLLPRRVAQAIARDPKFAKMEAFLKEIDREQKVFEKNRTFAKSDMGQTLVEDFDANREGYLGVMGKFLKVKVASLAAELNDISTRAGLIALETKTAEADWLEQGRNIENLERKRLPRPFIPDDTFQFWWFRNEYWIDELGYYEFTIKTECFE